MYINTHCEKFVPKNFVIHNFYGKDTCFAWNEHEIVCFPYIYKNSTPRLQVLKAPAKIKDVRSAGERVFILCLPAGIYKLTDNFEFVNLQKNGIELGSDVHEIFILNNKILVLDNKKLKSNDNLFSISSSNLQVCVVNYNNVDKNFQKIFLPDYCNNNVDLYLISNDKKLFKMFDKKVNLFYNCDYIIIEIMPVEKYEKIIGLLLKTDTNIVIFIHALHDKIKYDTIVLEVNLRTLCAVIDVNSENKLLIVCSDDKRTYYYRKTLFNDLVQEVKIEEKYYECLRMYKSKFLIYLNNHKELLQISIEQLRNANYQNINDCIKLELNMLKGLEKQIETICDKTTELKKLSKQMIENEDRLRRINLFINKQCIKYCPDEYVKKILNQIFLISNFRNALPKNSTVVKILKSKGKTTFSMKTVKDYDTIMEIPICTSNLSSKLNLRTDIITHKYENEIWCLIKNYIKNPIPSKTKKINLSTENHNFIKHKLIVLKNLMQSNNLSLEAISKIKRDVRQEIQLFTF